MEAMQPPAEPDQWEDESNVLMLVLVQKQVQVGVQQMPLSGLNQQEDENSVQELELGQVRKQAQVEVQWMNVFLCIDLVKLHTVVLNVQANCYK